MKYCENFEVSWHDADFNGMARPSIIWRYMQETANHQMRDEEPSYMDLYNKGMSFIVSRICIRFYKPLYEYEKIRVETWATDSKGASFNRCYQIIRDKEVIAEGYSTFALVDKETKRLYRVNEVELGYGSDKPLEMDVPIRFRIPEEENLVEVGNRKILYSDIDCNCHMNNTNYPDMISDFLPDIDKFRISAMCIKFEAEASFNGILKIFRSEKYSDDGVCYIRTFRDDLINIESMVKVEKI